MKILQVNKLYHPVLGGIEKITQDISEHLQTPNLEVSVLACQTKGKRQEETINDIKVYKAASWGKKLGMPISFDFFRLFKKIGQKYDIILIHHPFPLAFLALPLLPKKKIYIMYHADIIRQKWLMLPFLPFINYGLKRAEKIFVSGDNIVTHSHLLRPRQSKCIVNPFGIDLNEYKITDEIRRRAEIIKKEHQRPIILSVGRLVYYKGFRYLIEAMKNVKADLIIIGQGPDKKYLGNLIKKNDLNDKIQIIDPVNNLQAFYVASDLFVLPSCAPSEAFGLVQLEAMANNKAVVNTRLNTAVEEVSIDKVTGITVPPKNSLALSKAINELINNPQKKASYEEAARNRVEKIFRADAFYDSLKKHLLT